MASNAKTPRRGANEAEQASYEPCQNCGEPLSGDEHYADGLVRVSLAESDRRVTESFDEAYVRLFGCRTPPLGVRIENA